RLEREVEETVHGEQLEHVIEERQTRAHAHLAGAIELEADLHVRLFGPARASRTTRGWHQRTSLVTRAPPSKRRDIACLRARRSRRRLARGREDHRASTRGWSSARSRRREGPTTIAPCHRSVGSDSFP